MATKCHKIIQCKLKTIHDLKHHLDANGLARHVIHDSDTDWWWFADNRELMLEEVFNAGSPLVLGPPASSGEVAGEVWGLQGDPDTHVKGFRLTTPFASPKMSDEMLTDMFWTDFLNQEQERFAYWDMGNPDNGFEAYLFYREMHETGAYLETLNA